MLNKFNTTAKRGLLSVRFAIAVVLCTTIYWLGSLQESGSTDILYLLDASVTFSAFYHLFPIVAVLPLGSSLLEDVKSGYIDFILQRVSIRNYLITRFTASALLGALASMLGMLLFLLLLPIFHPMARIPTVQEAYAIYDYMIDVVAKRHWFTYFGFYAILQGMSGMMWSSIALMLSTFVEDTQLLYLSVVLSMEVLCRILFSFGLEHIILYTAGSINCDTISEVFMTSSSIFLGITFLCFIMFNSIGKRRLQHA